jgi:hypothetical protein
MWTAAGMVRKGSVVALVVLAAPVHIYAARPLEVNDAGTVEEGELQIEFGFEPETGANTKTLTAPFRITSGLTRWLEVGIEPSVLYSEDQEASPQRAAGAGDLRFGAKARLPISPFDIDLALLAAVKIQTADGQRGLGTGQVDMATRLIATKAFTEEQRLHFNIGYTRVGKVRGEQLCDLLFVGIAGETNVPVAAAKRFQAVAEVFGTTKKEAGGRTDIRGRVVRDCWPHVNLRCPLEIGKRAVRNDSRVWMTAQLRGCSCKMQPCRAIVSCKLP